MESSLTQLLVSIPFIALLLGTIFLSFQTRFIQVRVIPEMFQLLFKSFHRSSEAQNKVKAHKALFMAMSTTIGIGNIIGPLIAIGLGGPGAMLGYLAATIFGGAATYLEVLYAVRYSRKSGLAGPMCYLREVFSPKMARAYAWFGLPLIIIWSGAQSNAIAEIYRPYGIENWVTGAVFAVVTMAILIGGVKRVGATAEKLVPIMFVLYAFCMGWIVYSNLDKLPETLQLIWNSATNGHGLFTGAGIAALVGTMRWGLAKGFQSNEAGIGTAAIPHSAADTDSALEQGTLAILSVYSNGILCWLSGLAVLLTGAYKNYSTDSISIITNLFAEYFPGFGPGLLLLSTSLFVLSTLIGNGYNGNQFVNYLFTRKGQRVYYLCMGLSIFFSALFSVDLIWTLEDYLVMPVVLIHIVGLVLLSLRSAKEEASLSS